MLYSQIPIVNWTEAYSGKENQFRFYFAAFRNRKSFIEDRRKKNFLNLVNKCYILSSSEVAASKDVRLAVGTWETCYINFEESEFYDECIFTLFLTGQCEISWADETFLCVPPNAQLSLPFKTFACSPSFHVCPRRRTNTPNEQIIWKCFESSFALTHLHENLFSDESRPAIKLYDFK